MRQLGITEIPEGLQLSNIITGSIPSARAVASVVGIETNKKIVKKLLAATGKGRLSYTSSLL
jgi:hypothetical protein